MVQKREARAERRPWKSGIMAYEDVLDASKPIKENRKKERRQSMVSSAS
jgi:hypothetical protein